MEKESRGATVKIIGCLIAAAFIQTTLPELVSVALWRWLGYVDWLLLVVVYVGLQRNPVRVLMTGVAAGALHDSLTGGRGIGISGLSYLLAAYLVDRMAAWIVVDNLLIRFVAVSSASVVSTSIRLIFYRVLNVELSVLAGSKNIAATIVFSLFANLIVSVLFYLLLDRLFNKNSNLKMRRTEARRLRPRL